MWNSGTASGRILERFSVGQASGFDEWVPSERERRGQLVIQALHRLSVACTVRDGRHRISVA
jgi:hypothetical protein